MHPTMPLADMAPAMIRLAGPTILPNQAVRPSKPHHYVGDPCLGRGKERTSAIRGN